MCGYVLSSKVLKHRYASVTVSCSDPHQPAPICLMCLSLTASVLCCAALLQVITRLLIGCSDRTEESRSPVFNGPYYLCLNGVIKEVSDCIMFFSFHSD